MSTSVVVSLKCSGLIKCSSGALRYEQDFESASLSADYVCSKANKIDLKFLQFTSCWGIGRPMNLRITVGRCRIQTMGKFSERDNTSIAFEESFSVPNASRVWDRLHTRQKRKSVKPGILMSGSCGQRCRCDDFLKMSEH